MVVRWIEGVVAGAFLLAVIVAPNRAWAGCLPPACESDLAHAAVTVYGRSPADQQATIGMALNGLFTNAATGSSARYTAPDRGDPIPYIVDMETLPAGITSNDAMAAVSNAFGVWSDAAALTFVYAGTENFGQSADSMTNRDGGIYVQLHDLYDGLPSKTLLGFGGHSFRFNTNGYPGGGLGGRVGSNEFDVITRGYTMLNHTGAQMQVLSTFEEVLCHEIGHALSMIHSLDTNAMMYAMAHADGRGAALSTTDVAVIRQPYPTNGPPYGYDRIMEVLTDFDDINIPGINRIELRGYDQQPTVLTAHLTNESLLNGEFFLAGHTLSYTADSVFADAEYDPNGPTYIDKVDVRFSDGTNASPPVQVRVMRFSLDLFPTLADGLPDYWMSNYFGHLDPRAVDLSRAGDDADADGYVNLDEFVMGSDPTNSSSYCHILNVGATSIQWEAKGWEVYELHAAESVNGPYTLLVNPVLETGTAATITFPAQSSETRFFQVQKVP